MLAFKETFSVGYGIKHSRIQGVANTLMAILPSVTGNHRQCLWPRQIYIQMGELVPTRSPLHCSGAADIAKMPAPPVESQHCLARHPDNRPWLAQNTDAPGVEQLSPDLLGINHKAMPSLCVRYAVYGSVDQRGLTCRTCCC